MISLEALMQHDILSQQISLSFGASRVYKVPQCKLWLMMCTTVSVQAIHQQLCMFKPPT